MVMRARGLGIGEKNLTKHYSIEQMRLGMIDSGRALGNG
jgi:hypothetical protein